MSKFFRRFVSFALIAAIFCSMMIESFALVNSPVTKTPQQQIPQQQIPQQQMPQPTIDINKIPLKPSLPDDAQSQENTVQPGETQPGQSSGQPDQSQPEQEPPVSASEQPGQIPPGSVDEPAVTIDESASAWAVTELQQAYRYGLTYPGVMNQFRKYITREEFCTVVVKLHEGLTNRKTSAGPSPFTDTSNPEIIKANQLGIVNGMGGGKFRPELNITRQEISVMLFRALQDAKGNLDTPGNEDFPFSDKNKIASWAANALRFAYKHQVLKGVGNNCIAPLQNTSRQEALVILKRAFESFNTNQINPDSPGNNGSGQVADSQSGSSQSGTGQTDSSQSGTSQSGSGENNQENSSQSTLGGGISLRKPNIGGNIIQLPGTGSTGSGAVNTPDLPLSELKIPDDVRNGLTKVPGTDRAVKIIDSTVIVGDTDSPLSEKEKLKAFNRENRLAYPVYDTKLELKVAATEEKSSKFTSANGSALIDQNGVKTRWFKFDLSGVTNAKKVVWQVSRSPFIGFSDNWKNPVGLVRSGEVDASAGQFQIDFGTFNPVPNAMDMYRIGPDGILTWGGDHKVREIPSVQKVYYVRAVPVDAGGACIGDPGAGVSVLYGKPMTAPLLRDRVISPSFELWSTKRQNVPTKTPEFPNSFEHTAQRGTSCESSLPYWFQLKGFDPASVKAVIQVSAKPFTGKLSDWESPDGLVYSNTYDKLPITQYYDGDWINAVPIDFTGFGPKADKMKPGDKVQYYVRAVALKPYSGFGSVTVAFSDTVSINYYKQQPLTILTPETKVVESLIPDIRVKSYMPIQREDPNWDKYYLVYRKPLWNEINCKFKDKKTGAVLYPYACYVYLYSQLGYDHVPSVIEYENDIIPRVLKEGTRVTIKPAQESSSWWGDLWDDIVNFFKDLAKLVAKVVNWASQAYNGLKSSLIDFVANAIPIPGLKGALEIMVNAGLMALGMPPTLPNFDQLCGQGLDYLAQVALTTAGVPANEMTDELLSETADSIGSEVKKSYNKESPNPIDSPFLRNHPDYMEKPAYIEIELSNPYNKASLPGSFNIDAQWCYNKNLSIPADMGFTAQSQIKFLLHLLEGLKKGCDGEPSYPVFKPVRDYKIPALKPGEKQVVKIYLDPYYGSPYPFAPEGEAVTEMDFICFYLGYFGMLDFSVYTSPYALPDPREVALAQKFVPSSDKIYTYRYDKLYSSDSFKSEGDEAYIH